MDLVGRKRGVGDPRPTHRIDGGTSPVILEGGNRLLGNGGHFLCASSLPECNQFTTNMTAYKNFVEDFPRRCRDILDFARKPALSRGLEVTLSLMVASAGLIVPYERLKPDGRFGDHPSGDNKTFADAAIKLKLLLDEPFVTSRLWSQPNSTWQDGKLDSVKGYPETWEGLQKRRPISNHKKVSAILTVVRNALAHGNIFTFNSRENMIEGIIFIKANFNEDSVIRNYSFLYVAPKEFQQFLRSWFDFLYNCHIPQVTAFEVLKDAA